MWTPYIALVERAAQLRRLQRQQRQHKLLKRCYLPLTLALDFATPASTRVAPSSISVDGKIMSHCVIGLVV